MAIRYAIVIGSSIFFVYLMHLWFQEEPSSVQLTPDIHIAR